MEENLAGIEERLAKIEVRMKTHWALQTDPEFAENYVRRLRNELHASILKMAMAAIVLLAGSGFVFIKYAVVEQFSSENSRLITSLKVTYEEQVKRTDSNFEWRRFHDYGKDYVNLATLYNKSPMEETKKKSEIHGLLDEAARYFKKALEQGDMQASTFWELGELNYTYRINMGLDNEVDKFKAIEQYKNAASRYTEVEVSKGWRAEAYYKIGVVYLDAQDDKGVNNSHRKTYIDSAKKYLLDANSEYSKYRNLTDERSRKNIENISSLLAQIERVAP